MLGKTGLQPADIFGRGKMIITLLLHDFRGSKMVVTCFVPN